MKSIKIWHAALFFFPVTALLYFYPLLFSLDRNMELYSIPNLILFIAVFSFSAFIFTFRNRISFLKVDIKLQYTVLFVICTGAILAPIITPYSPDEIISASECRLLSPFSSVDIVYKSTEGEGKLFTERIAAVKIIAGEKILIIKKGKETELDKSGFVLTGGNPLIRKAFFILGTDEFGRDLFTRVVYGARTSLFVSLTASFISLLIAGFFSLSALTKFKIAGIVSNRISELFLAIPSLFIIIFAISLFGASLISLIMVLAVTSWTPLFKILNGEIKRIMNKNFIISSMKLGIPLNRIFIREIIPLILPSIIVNLIFQIANFIIVELSLSFLGLGAGNNISSWGSIIESGFSYLSNAWWLILCPGICLFLTILALNKSGKKIEQYFNPLLR